MLFDWIILAASFILQFILIPKPQNKKPASLEDFQIPVLEEGKELGILSGTELLKGPNVTWWGDVEAKAIKGERRYGFFGPKATIGYKYYIGMQMVLCTGPIDRLWEIWVGDKLLWDGEISGGKIYIEEWDFFGGEEKGGGIVGEVELCTGGPDQEQNDYLAKHLGADCPAFRGVTTIVLRHVYIGTSYYLKPWAFKVSRIYTKSDGTEQWYPSKAGISRGGQLTSVPYYDVDGPSAKLIDWGEDIIAMVNDAKTHLKIIDANTGAIINTVEIGCIAHALMISDSQHEIMIWCTSGPIYSYNYDGSFKYSHAGFGALTGGTRFVRLGDEYVLDGTTYLLFLHMAHTAGYWRCLANEGDGWRYLWRKSVWGGLGPTGTWLEAFSRSISMSATRVYFSMGDNVVYYRYWNPFGMSGRHAPSHSLENILYGIQVRTTFAYNERYDCVVVIGKHLRAENGVGGFVATVSPDLQTQIEYVTGLNWGTMLFTNTFSSRRVFGRNGMTIVFSATTGFVGGYDDTIHEWSISPLQEIKTYSYGLWNQNDFPPSYYGTSPGTHAVLLVEQSTGVNARVELFFLGDILEDMNPSHIIREYLTDPYWGMGYNEADIDDAAFTYAADLFYAEGFGLTIFWVRQEQIEEMVNIVLAHANAVLYTSRKTGKFVLKPIRNDYNIATLPIIDDDDIIEWKEIKRRQPTDAITSITVQYTERKEKPATSEEASATFHNDAQIHQSGGIILDNRNYPGISRNELAMRVAERDQHPFNAGMITGSFSGKRSLQSLNPGSPFRLVSTRHNLEGEVMRVTDMHFADARDNTIDVIFIQDQFRLGAKPLADTSGSQWKPPGSLPQPVDPRLVWEMPYVELLRMIGETSATSLLGSDPDFGMTGVAGEQPTEDTTRIFIYDGGTKRSTLEFFAPAGFLVDDISAFEDGISLTGATNLEDIVIGSLAAIVEPNQLQTEIIRIEGMSGVNLLVSRGMLDTIPRPHLAGRGVVVFDDFSMSDFVERTAGAAPFIRLLSETTLGVKSLTGTPGDTVTFAGRAIRPFRPANVTVEGVSVGPVDGTLLAGFDVAWVDRNRLLELETFKAWDDATVEPESGQTTIIEVLNMAESVVTSYTGLTIGDSPFFVPTVGLGGYTRGWIRVGSERDGKREWQAYKIEVFSTDIVFLDTDPVELDGEQVLLG